MLNWNDLNDKVPGKARLWFNWVFSLFGLTTAYSKQEWELRDFINNNMQKGKNLSSQHIVELHAITQEYYTGNPIEDNFYLAGLETSQKRDTINWLIQNRKAKEDRESKEPGNKKIATAKDNRTLQYLWDEIPADNRQECAKTIIPQLARASYDVFQLFTHNLLDFVTTSFSLSDKFSLFDNIISSTTQRPAIGSSAQSETKIMASLDSRTLHERLQLQAIASGIFTPEERLAALKGNTLSSAQITHVYDDHYWEVETLEEALVTNIKLFELNDDHPQIIYFSKLDNDKKIMILLRILELYKTPQEINTTINNFFRCLKIKSLQGLTELMTAMIKYDQHTPSEKLKNIIGRLLNNEIPNLPKLPKTKYYQLLSAAYTNKSFIIPEGEEKEEKDPIIFPPTVHEKALKKLSDQIEEKKNELSHSYFSWLERQNVVNHQPVRSFCNHWNRFINGQKSTLGATEADELKDIIDELAYVRGRESWMGKEKIQGDATSRLTDSMIHNGIGPEQLVLELQKLLKLIQFKQELNRPSASIQSAEPDPPSPPKLDLS
jgi:hypothetical protein